MPLRGQIGCLVTYRTAVYSPLWEAGADHPAANLDGVKLLAVLLSNEVHCCLLELLGHHAWGGGVVGAHKQNRSGLLARTAQYLKCCKWSEDTGLPALRIAL